MIRIKDYIFNEDEIHHIVKRYTTNSKELYIYFNNGHESMILDDAALEDIEWNYGTPQETQRKIQKELCKSCYYRDTISNEVKRLEKNNQIFEDTNFDLNRQIEKLEEENKELKEIIDKINGE